MKKNVKVAILAGILSTGILGGGIAQALPFVSFEAGGIVGADIKNIDGWKFDKNTDLTYGAYGRIWLKPGSFRIAPFVKWESIDGVSLSGALDNIISGNDIKRNNNLQYGVLAGFEVFYITPYVGIAYSQFTDPALSNTWALNYGVKVKIPILPLTIGIDGSWQQPKSAGIEVNMNRIGATLGLQF